MHDLHLPVSDILVPLQQALTRSAVVLQAPPGAGKSTALPLSLLQAFPTKRWILVQPRRLAALSIAEFIASRLNEPCGQTVGYQVRQDAKRSARTRLLVVTEGILTRMLQTDPMLSDIDGVIFDEFHERNLHSDLGLALTLETRQLRPELALLVMSATLPAQALADWMAGHGTEAEVLQSEGRQYAVDIEYQPPRQAQSYLEKTADVVNFIIREYPQNRGVLVFLPGQSEIRRVMQAVAASSTDSQVELLALHGGLTLSEQQGVTATQRTEQRRVIFTTNIAETSLTIAGIDWVVDSGRERQALYRPKYHTTELMTRRVARAAAIQRAGRAGRTGPGRCTRIYAPSDYQGMAEYRPADIEQQDLTDLVLQVACWGSAMDEMAWFTPPNAGHVASAQQWLRGVGALNDRDQATSQGQALLSYAADVRYAQAFSAAQETATLTALALLVAMDEERESETLNLADAVEDVLTQKAQFPRTWRRYRHWCRQLKLECTTHCAGDSLIKAALCLYPLGLARQRKETDYYTLATGAGVGWPANTAVSMSLKAAPWLLVSGLSMHQDMQHGVIRQCLALSADQVSQLMEHDFAQRVEQHSVVEWRSERGGLHKVDQRCYFALELQRKPSPVQVSGEERLAALVLEVQRNGLSMLNWDARSVQIQRRLALWATHSQDAPQVDDEHLLETLHHWAVPYWHHIENRPALSNWSPGDALMSLLPYPQQQSFNQALPTHWQAPSGRAHLIEYQADGSALVALKLQEVFGSPSSPTVLNGRLPLTLDLLSPAKRPLQRTSDLAAFWAGSYIHVKKEMRGRYPKHPWPDDPAQAQATHLTKKAMHDQGK
ncbi:MAG: ATP-dependent helicase HrpB [Idiomarina sp.]|nr:ATP-dependent helicase HrpB [Idiomarina sp.]